MTPALLLLVVRIGLIGALYAFLAAALWIVWRNLPGRPAARSSGAQPAYRAVWRDARTGRMRALPLVQETCLIGRAANAEIRIEEETVSFMHARLIRRESRWWLEDLDSRNGTLLNGAPITEPAVLAAGDLIQVGSGEIEIAEQPAGTQSG